jgi:MoxR-like ATPase
MTMEANVKEHVPQDMLAFKAMAGMMAGEMKRVVVGKDELIFDLFVALLSKGNILLEGVPGVAKTTIARAFAQATGLDFKRIQFMPDILPSDVIGALALNPKTRELEIYKGPIFTNILLVDEINRASPKIQSALLEAMEEKQVSIGGITFKLPDPFMVITTQNPIDVIGTYALPEAQIDRFMFKLDVGYPSDEEELEMLKIKNIDAEEIIGQAQAGINVAGMVDVVKSVQVDEKILTYIRDVVSASRKHDKLLLGASPRASIALLRGSKAVAALNGRDFVISDDVQYLAPRVLNHRLIVKPEHEQEHVTPETIIKELLDSTKIIA